MVRIELKRYMRMFRRRELLRFVDDELNCPQMLDEYRPNRSGGYTRLYGPELSFHVFSSNVPGIPVWSMTMGLLTKSAILGQIVVRRAADAGAVRPFPGKRRPRYGGRFGDCALAWRHRGFGGCRDWRGGCGGLRTVRRTPPRRFARCVRAGKPFLSYGAKIGFSLIGREALRARPCMPAPCIVWRSTWPHTTSKAVWRRKPCSWNVAARCLRRRSPNCLPANWTGSSANIPVPHRPKRSPWRFSGCVPPRR